MAENNETPSVEKLESFNKTFEEKLKDFSTRLFSLSPLLVAIGIAMWWCLEGMVKITGADLTIENRIALTAITIFIAMVYCNLISTGGFQAAKKSPEYKVCSKDWNDAIKRGNTNKAEIIEYAKDIARVNQRELRIKNLENVGLNYSDIFDEKGELIRLDYERKYNKKKNPNGFTRGQIKIIKHCINIRIDIPEMFGNISSKFFGLQKRASQKSYEIKTNVTNGIIRAVAAFFAVGITFAWVGLSFEALISAIFQIVLWTGSGVLQRMKNYNFIINKILPQIVENTLIINGYMDLEDSRKQIYINRAKEEAEKKFRKQIPTNLIKMDI